MPWTPDTLRPLFTELVPILEDFDCESLKSAAKEIAPEAAQIVAGYKWNPKAKSALVTSGSAVSAKWLNKAGVSAENAPEVSLGIAALSIYWGRSLVTRALTALAEEKKREREREREEKGSKGERERNAHRADN